MTTSLIIKGGHLLTQDPALGELIGDILVEDGRIAQVAPKIESGADEVLDAAGFAVLPGFVDTHRHTWQTCLRGMAAGDSLAGYQKKIQQTFGALFTPEDVYAGNLLGAAGAGQTGITTLCDESHVQNSPAHTDAAVEALRDSGIRAVFDYGWPSTDSVKWMFNSDYTHPTYVTDLKKKPFWNDDSLVSLRMMLRGPLMTPDEITVKDVAFARGLGLRSAFHVAAGAIARLHALGLLGPDMMFIHCCDSTDEELQMVAEAGASISSSPNLELNMLGLGNPPIRRFLAAGVRPSFSIDVETSVSGDMFTVMRAALLSQTAEELYQPGQSALPNFSPRDILSFATLEGARAAGLDHKIGSLAPGKRADIVMIDMNASNLAPVTDEYIADVIVASAHPGNVEHVLVDGRFIRRGGKPVDTALLRRAGALAAASRARLRRAARAAA